MAWSAPPTFADTNILTAAQLNILSDDVEYLYGLVSGVNVPFNSLTTTVNLDDTNNQWLMRHVYKYLHYKLRVASGQNDDLDIYMVRGTQDIRIFGESAARTGGYSYSGYIDLEDVTTWLATASGDQDIYMGAWGTTTSYDDFDIVLEAGTYYICPVGKAHTSGTFATDLAAGSWVAIGTSVNLWTAGTRYRLWVDTNETSAFTFTVDYLLESDATSL